jgi:hypothetical protein
MIDLVRYRRFGENQILLERIRNLQDVEASKPLIFQAYEGGIA